jgi:polysaccharide biosynthesis/export protein
MRTEQTSPAGVPRYALIALVVTAALCDCNMRAIPGLTTPDLALATPAPLPPAAAAYRAVRAGTPGVPVVPLERYTLDSGDRVRITVFGQDNLSRVYGVDGSGYVALPLVGAVRARGLTTGELAATITRGLDTKYVKDPKVTAEVDTYRPVFVLGEVKKAGQFPYVNAMTVEMAVAIAEGYTERANLCQVRLTRRFGGVRSTVMVPPDYPVQPGELFTCSNGSSKQQGTVAEAIPTGRS